MKARKAQRLVRQKGTKVREVGKERRHIRREGAGGM